MGYVAVSRLAYAHPGGELLFSEVSFRISPGDHVGLVGANGVGKSTLLRILTGELPADDGEHSVGGISSYMAQDVGAARDSRTVRELLLSMAPLVLEVLFGSDADVLLLDEPDNFLDVPAKLALERQIRESRKTVLMISHDREVLSGAVRSILTLEGNGAWLHGGPYSTYPQAREERQRRLGDAVKRWREEERRLFRLMKTFKERARYSPDWAKKANAAESRWRRFSEAGPPPAPVVDSAIGGRLRGGDSARPG